MALQSSGAISLSDIQTEFGGSNPISLSEYYRGGSYVTSNNTNVPTSGEISVNQFYNAVNQYSLTISANTQEANLYSIATNDGWNGSDPILVTIQSGVYLWSDSTSTAGLIISSAFNSLLSIVNNGYIIGKGGNGGTYTGAGGAGGPAISNSATGVSITNNSGAYIAGGGGGGGGRYGGGGGGAGGGAGGRSNPSSQSNYGGAGGSVGAEGADGSGWNTGLHCFGGEAGGAGGYQDETSGGSEFGTGGGGGGRILPGTQTANATVGVSSLYSVGKGGGGGQAGGNGATSGNAKRGGGGGGWGAAGGAGVGAGGAAGAAISGTSISVTNNGTIYGSQA